MDVNFNLQGFLHDMEGRLTDQIKDVKKSVDDLHEDYDRLATRVTTNEQVLGQHTKHIHGIHWVGGSSLIAGISALFRYVFLK